MKQKSCGRCHELKAIEDFHNDRNRDDGKNPYCKQCVSTLAKAHYKRNREVMKARARKWEQANPERTKKLKRRWWEKHRAQHGLAIRRWMKKNPEAVRKNRRAYYRRAPYRVKANQFVRDLVRKGLMPSPRDLRCTNCTKMAECYHHHLGYERDHWEDVIPLCNGCHTEVHRHRRVVPA